MTQHPHHPQARLGLLLGLSAYLIWGFIPAYYKVPAMSAVPPVEVVGHRIVWSAVMLGVMIAMQRSWGEVRAAVGSRRLLLALTASGLLLGLNWLVFLWAVSTSRVLQSSLGYFMNPLINVALGMIFLRERLRVMQGVAIALAAAGVAVMTVRAAEFPWMAITLGTSFGFYGLIRKTVRAGPQVGLTIETALLAPFALAAVAYWMWMDVSSAGWRSPRPSLGLPSYSLLVLTGPITVIPLLLFTHAARRLRLSTMGFLQYIGPTCQFLLAVLVYAEPLDRYKQIAFGFVWAGLLVYMIDAVGVYRRFARGQAVLAADQAAIAEP
jgi:chloramphenicol-sensitive protein RarD